jgi:hypothetical protein
MELLQLLSQKRSAVLKKWLQAILETYPADGRRFLGKQKDRFANPVGYTLAKETENLFDEILRGVEPDRVRPILDRIVRVRAVQDFTPAEALSFIFLLKGILREEFKGEVQEKRLLGEVFTLESQIDEVALIAFDIYVGCRETLYEMKANQIKNQVSRLLERAGLISEVPDWKPRDDKDNG